MEKTVYTPQKGRLEIIDLTITEENTTWFDDSQDHKIHTITDCYGDLVIQQRNYDYPLRVYDLSRADIKFDPQKAQEIYQLNLQE